MDQISYQSYEQPIGFKPIRQPDIIPELDREHARQNRARQAYLAGLRRNEAVQVQNAKQLGIGLQDLGRGFNDLAKFSTTLAKRKAEADAEALKQEEINATYDVLTEGNQFTQREQQQEEADIEQGSREAQAVSAFQQKVEQQTEDIGLSEAVRLQADTPLARGFRGEKAALMRAQITYSPWMANWMRSNNELSVMGNTYTIQEAVASGDTRLIAAAVAQGRLKFIEENGLQFASKTNFVKMLGQTMISTDAQISGSVAREAIKFNREEQRQALEGQGYQIGQTTQPSQVASQFRNLAEQMWLSGAYKTRGKANDAALDSIIEGMTDRGDVDGLRALLITEKIEGNRGTRLQNNYANKINDAIEVAQSKQDGILKDNLQQIETEMFEDLAKAKNPGDRDNIIEAAAKELEANGEWKKARELRQQRDELSTEGSNDRTTAMLSEGIRLGEVTNAKDIEQAFLKGQITRQQFNSLSKELAAKSGGKTPTNKIASGLVTTYSKRFKNDFMAAMGLKADALGNFTDFNGALVSAADAELIAGQAKTEMNIIANQILRENPGISDVELQREVTKRLEEWWKAETQTDGGRYQLNDILEQKRNSDPRKQELTPQQQQRFNDLADGKGKRPFASAYPTGVVGPQDFTRRQSSIYKDDFNPLRGDKVFTRDVVEDYQEQFKDGVISKHLQRTADDLGMTPLSLLQQQAASYGLPTIRPSDKPTSNVRSSTSSAPLNSVQGATRLMELGFPVRGASWLAGNIQTESSWSGQRSWDDGGAMAGGLASWRGSRLENLEATYGRPVSQITTEEQLQFLVKELKSYPEANRIFRNPYATDRQLMRASKQFWVYGIRGDRYNYAQQIEQSLTNKNSGGTLSRKVSSNATQLIGMDTSSGPDRGINACAWAVNKVLAAAGIESPWNNSLYVPTIKNVLDKKGKKLDGPQPGAIAIMVDNGSPPYPHIGIVDNDGMIISNSSSRARFDWRDTPEAYDRAYGRPTIYYAI